MVSALKYFMAPFKDEAVLALLSVESRWSNRFAFGFLKEPLLLNMSASEKAATPVEGGFDDCRCGKTSSRVKIGRVSPLVRTGSFKTTEDVSVRASASAWGAIAFSFVVARRYMRERVPKVARIFLTSKFESQVRVKEDCAR
jgi:hypothetical protein